MNKEHAHLLVINAIPGMIMETALLAMVDMFCPMEFVSLTPTPSVQPITFFVLLGMEKTALLVLKELSSINLEFVKLCHLNVKLGMPRMDSVFLVMLVTIFFPVENVNCLLPTMLIHQTLDAVSGTPNNPFVFNAQTDGSSTVNKFVPQFLINATHSIRILVFVLHALVDTI